MTEPVESSVGLLRRLAAILYDSMLLLGLLVAGAAGADLVVKAMGGSLDPQNIAYQLYLLLLMVAFFCYFWLTGGQTLGMQAWRIQVVRRDGQPLTLTNALVRFGAALISWLPLGLGFWWSLLPPAHEAWHDRWSGTRLRCLPKS